MPGMMEKGPELLGRSRAANGGAKSPAGGGGGAAATNGGLASSEPESGGSSDDEHDVGMRVGAEYQARIPEFDPGSPGGHGTRAPTRIGPELGARRRPGWSPEPPRTAHRREGPGPPAHWPPAVPHCPAWAPPAPCLVHSRPKRGSR